MTQTTQPTVEDIAYVRQLAESGARAPLTGGRFIAWWGLVVALAWTAHHLALKGVIGDGRWIFVIIWGTVSLVGVAGQLLLARGMPAMAGEGSAGNRASRSAWLAAAAAIVAMVVGCVIASRTAGYGVFDWIVPVAFAGYASAQFVTGSLAGNRTIMMAGAGAIAMTGIFTAFIFHPDRYLFAVAGVVLTVLLPGLLLLRAEPRARD
jgi:hypothetical protein